MRIVFHVLDDDAENVTLGSVTWDGQTAHAEPADIPFLAHVAQRVQQAPDPQKALEELPHKYTSPYLRAEIAGQSVRESLEPPRPPVPAPAAPSPAAAPAPTPSAASPAEEPGESDPFGYHPSAQQGDVITSAHAALPSLAGRSPRETLQALHEMTGAPEGWRTQVLSIRRGGSPGVRVLASNPTVGGSAERDIVREGGKTVAYNEKFSLPFKGKKGGQGQGIGTGMFSRQVDAMAKHGVSEIRAPQAARGPGQVGYNVWPKMGYDAPVPLHIRALLLASNPTAAFKVRTLRDVLRLPGGGELWKKWGVTTPMSFDLSPGSQHRKVLNEYLAGKGRTAVQESQGWLLLDVVVGCWLGSSLVEIRESLGVPEPPEPPVPSPLPPEPKTQAPAAPAPAPPSPSPPTVPAAPQAPRPLAAPIGIHTDANGDRWTIHASDDAHGHVAGAEPDEHRVFQGGDGGTYVAKRYGLMSRIKPLPPGSIERNDHNMFIANTGGPGKGEQLVAGTDRDRKNRKHWEVSFTDEEGSHLAHGEAGGKAHGVFSRVASAMHEFLTTRRPRRFSFSADGESRVRLYDRFANEIAKKFGYQLKREADPDDNSWAYYKFKRIAAPLVKPADIVPDTVPTGARLKPLPKDAPLPPLAAPVVPQGQMKGGIPRTPEEQAAARSAYLRALGMRESREGVSAGDLHLLLESSPAKIRQVYQQMSAVSVPQDLVRRVEAILARRAAPVPVRESLEPPKLPAAAAPAASATPSPSPNPTGTPAFQSWFQKSHVTDEAGAPLRVFHGTTREFDQFDSQHGAANTDNPTGVLGHFFSNSPKESSRYATDFGNKQAGRTVPVYLSLQNPYRMPYREFNDLAMGTVNSLRSDPEYDPNATVKFGDEEGQRRAAARMAKHNAIARDRVLARRNELIKLGHDGVIVDVGGNKEYIAFHGHQIKSAIGNRGTFNPADARIRESQEPVTDGKKKRAPRKKTAKKGGDA